MRKDQKVFSWTDPGKVPLKSVVSHVYKFDDIIEGVNYNIDNKADVIKAVIEM